MWDDTGRALERQDDIDHLRAEAEADKIWKLAQLGVCFHGDTQGIPGTDGRRCVQFGCGKTWPNRNVLQDEIDDLVRRALAHYRNASLEHDPYNA